MLTDTVSQNELAVNGTSIPKLIFCMNPTGKKEYSKIYDNIGDLAVLAADRNISIHEMQKKISFQLGIDFKLNWFSEKLNDSIELGIGVNKFTVWQNKTLKVGVKELRTKDFGFCYVIENKLPLLKPFENFR